MWIDPIVEEIYQIREAYAAKFNYDIEAICRDIREQERLSGREFVTLPLKSPPDDTEGEAMQYAQGIGVRR